MDNNPNGPLGPPILAYLLKVFMIGGAIAAFAVDHRTTITSYVESLPPIPLQYGVEPALFYMVNAIATTASK